MSFSLTHKPLHTTLTLHKKKSNRFIKSRERYEVICEGEDYWYSRSALCCLDHSCSPVLHAYSVRCYSRCYHYYFTGDQARSKEILGMRLLMEWKYHFSVRLPTCLDRTPYL